jgi:hypothetical protein
MYDVLEHREEFLHAEMWVSHLQAHVSKISGTCDFLCELLADPAVALASRSKPSCPQASPGQKREAMKDEWMKAALMQSRLPTPTLPSL